LEADDQLANDIAALQYLKERSKEGQDEFELLDQRVRAAIGSAECVTDSTGRVLATYKVSRVGRVDTKALLARYPRAGEKFKVFTEQRRLLIK
jgi:predicted phage-related endonuclease